MFGASYLRTIAAVITLFGAFFCGITGRKLSAAVSVATAAAGTTAPTVVISPESKPPATDPSRRQLIKHFRM